MIPKKVSIINIARELEDEKVIQELHQELQRQLEATQNRQKPPYCPLSDDDNPGFCDEDCDKCPHKPLQL